MQFKKVSLTLKVALLIFTALVSILPLNVVAEDTTPSPTKVPTPADAVKVLKIHHWNLLNLARYNTDGDPQTGAYGTTGAEDLKKRDDFDLTIPSTAWKEEELAALSLTEICKTEAEKFALDSNIPEENYQFADYKGSSDVWVVSNNNCTNESNDPNDAYGIALYVRGETIDKEVFRYTGEVAAEAYGDRGTPCIKHRYLELILTSCAIHTSFDGAADTTDRFKYTRLEVSQIKENAEALSSEGIPGNFILLPGDYNLSPDRKTTAQPGATGDPINQPLNFLGDGYHGFNEGNSYSTGNPAVRLDYIYFSKGLHFVPDTLPLCSGPGLVSPTTAPDEYPTGDHCYIGAIAYLTQTEVEIIAKQNAANSSSHEDKSSQIKPPKTGLEETTKVILSLIILSSFIAGIYSARKLKIKKLDSRSEK